METNKKHIYFLCPGIEWDKPTTGGLLYNYVFIHALKKQYGDEAVVPLNLIGDGSRSWLKQRLAVNLKYLKYFLSRKLERADLVLVDSRTNSLLLLPLLYLRFFSPVSVGMTVFHIYYPMSGRQGILRTIEKKCEKLFINCSSFIITISRSTLRGITELSGKAQSGKVLVRIIPPGLKTADVSVESKKRTAQKQPRLNLLYVGTCEDPRKGLDYLIQAVAGLSSANFRLHLAGKQSKTNAYFRHLCQYIEKYKLGEKIVFLGRVSDQQLQQLYCDADIFVFPSLWEGYGIVLAEAMTHGLPVVATNISSIPEIVRNGENGILVPPGNVELLIQALDALINDDELRRKMAEKSVEFARDFKDWEEVGRDLVECIDKLIVVRADKNRS